MENLFYWIIEYGFLMFVWPMVVFRRFLAGKGATFRFGFCVTAQIVIINTVVLMLGLLHVLNDWTLRIVFYGIFLFSIRKWFVLTPERKNKFKYLINGSFGVKNFIRLEFRKYARILEEFVKLLWKYYKQNWLEYSLLVIAVAYGMIYFSWGVFHDRSYGFSDMYVHHSWIYQLSEGNPFSSGIYPEGMHCFIYALNGLFGIRIFSGMLFAPAVNIGVILISAYCLMKELFHWRYSSLFALVFFITFGEFGRSIVLCFARAQCALPQEFAFSAIFLCALFLIRYLRGGCTLKIKGKETKGYWDEDLLVFLLAFATTIVVHFYATIMAFFLCLGIAVFFWKRIFTRERFIPLVVSVITGLFISVFPMVIGFASGIPLQGSLHWAMEVMQNSSEQVNNQSKEVNTPKIDTEIDISPNLDNTSDLDSTYIGSSNESLEKEEKSFVEEVSEKIYSVLEIVCEKGKATVVTIYNKTYLLLYEEVFANIILLIMAVTIIVGCIMAVICWSVKVVRKCTLKRMEFSGYISIIFSSIVFIVAFTSTWIGLPMLIDRSRICFICHLLVVMILFFPIDIVFTLVEKRIPRWILLALSVCLTVAIVFFVYSKGFLHGFLYFELTRYDATVQVVNKIIESLPKNSYTIVSPTEELYQVIEHGRHEELLDFIEKQEDDIYTLPTEYVFIFLEKRPFRYVQYHFFNGPKWLGYDKYQETYGIYSTCPEYIAAEISEEAAKKPLMYFRKLSDSYSDWTSRTIIQSKIYKWCEKFKEAYPYEMKVFYEDEYFVCYYFQQNPQHLYNLVIE